MSGFAFRAVNPATEAPGLTLPGLEPAELTSIVEAADNAFRQWREAPLSERAGTLTRLASELRGHAEKWARVMTSEMGKPIAQARFEVEKCALVCEYYRDRASDFLAPQMVESGASKSMVSYEPLGLIMAIMPWNFPFWQVVRFAAPALTAGNGVLLKHAPSTPGCADALETIFRRAGYPDNLFHSLVIDHEQAAQLIADPRIRGVTLTGSGRAGRAVASVAGRHLKKTVLELGGSDASVVLEDADLDGAADSIVHSRLINTGQSCIAAKRLIAVEAVYDAMVGKVVERMEAATMGDPASEDTTLGPLAREDLRERLHEQVKGSVARGAQCLTGGYVPDRVGWFYPPTVLGNVEPGMPAFDEELFGPVAAIVRARDEDDAVRLANDTSFGLGGSVYTADVERGVHIARRRMEAGSCFVNGFVRSDPRLPFGGVKESGYGRELSRFGMHEFVNVKTVWVA